RQAVRPAGPDDVDGREGRGAGRVLPRGGRRRRGLGPVLHLRQPFQAAAAREAALAVVLGSHRRAGVADGGVVLGRRGHGRDDQAAARGDAGPRRSAGTGRREPGGRRAVVAGGSVRGGGRGGRRGIGGGAGGRGGAAAAGLVGGAAGNAGGAAAGAAAGAGHAVVVGAERHGAVRAQQDGDRGAAGGRVADAGGPG